MNTPGETRTKEDYDALLVKAEEAKKKLADELGITVNELKNLRGSKEEYMKAKGIQDSNEIEFKKNNCCG